MDCSRVGTTLEHAPIQILPLHFFQLRHVCDCVAKQITSLQNAIELLKWTTRCVSVLKNLSYLRMPHVVTFPDQIKVV